MQRITKDHIIKDLRNLNINKGDILFITIDILKVGYFENNRQETLSNWINILLDLVGKEGAIIFAAYTKLSLIFSNKKTVFHRYSETITGSLPNFLINHPNSIRSSHPTHSVIAIGEKVRKIIEKHNHNTSTYSIMGDLINLPNCKFIMIGTIDKKNAPQAMHYAQEVLGYTKKTLFKYLFKSHYFINHKQKLFIKKDFGGCSRGAYKLFSNLILDDSVNFFYVGKAKTAVMDSKKSFITIKTILQKDRNYIYCDNIDCIDCNGVLSYKFYYGMLNKIIAFLKLNNS